MPANRTLELLLAATLAGCSATPRGPAPAVTGDGTVPGSEQAASAPSSAKKPMAGGPSAPGGQAKSSKSPDGLPIHGQFSSRFRFRSGEGDEDSDFYQTLSLDVGDPSRQRLTAHLMGRLAYDFDDRNPGDELFELNDTWDSDLTGRLYHAYVDVERVPRVELLRLGRQQLLETPEIVTFDGARVESAARGKIQWSGGVYGGLPTHFYESSAEGDRVFGAYAQARPWKGGRMRADWMHLEDEQRLGEFDNDLVGLQVWQTLNDELLLEGRYHRLENEDRDLRLAAHWYDPTAQWQISASYFELLEAQTALANELDPFFNALHEYFPYRQGGLLVSKRLTERVDLAAGADLRRVSDSDDEGEFNRDYERFFATLGLDDWLDEGLSLSLTGDLWDAGSDDVSSLGAALEKSFNPRFSLELGSYYSLYKYNLQLDQERDDVRTVYARARLRQNERASRIIDLSYEFEDTDLGDYHVVKVGATWRF